MRGIMNRRDTLRIGAVATAGALTDGAALVQAQAEAPEAAKPLRILILGGTGFIGPHFVEVLRAGGHRLTLFNRGRRNPGLFPDLETLTGDRNGEVDALKNRDWDAVIDNSGYLPRQVRLTAGLLKDHASYYLFISSISAYADLSPPGIDEEAKVAELDDPDTEDIGRYYGPLKAACEKVVEETYGSRGSIVRPTYIVGPGDATDRFTYWPVRVARGGTVLAPGAADDPMQFIDVRDLADFVRGCVEQRHPGRYNACNRPRSATIGQVLETSKQVAKSDAEFVWVSAAFLESQRVLGGNELPLYADPRGKAAGIALVSSGRAEAKGLRFRKLADTIADTLAWHRQRPEDQQRTLRAGLTTEREAELLASWKAAPK